MKTHLSVALLLAGAVACRAADAPSLKDARLRWLKGDYEEASSLYEDLAKEPKPRTEAVVGRSRALESVGEYDKALDAVEAALKDAPKEPALLARQAELLYLRGRWDDAEKAANAAIDASKPEDLPHFQGRWVRAQIYRDRGNVADADKEFRWFVRTYTERSNKDDDIKDPEELLIVGLAGSENARWHNLSNQFKFILQTLYVDAEKEANKAKEPLWQAEYQAGALLLEKYNQPEAVNSFDKALAMNPRAAEALVGKGAAALQKMEIKQADNFADQALKINPRLPDALLLKADVQLTSGEISAALETVGKALAVNPRDEHSLARQAACLKVAHKKDDYEGLVKAVEKNNPKPAVFYFDLGERLEDRRWYDDAEACYKKAAELQPMLPGPAGTLGLLYMRLGREEEAAPLLDQGFAADKFNIRIANTRKVLKHLQTYETLQTDHFLVRFDPKNDGPLAHYMAEYLEKIYADLSEKFQYRPKGPILIEVFNSHEMFSGRVVALPDLHTVGASTGRMFAIASPNGKGVPKVFNWARVLRHEMVHIFNLEQTNFQTPHWLTEGLAVNNEGFPRPQQWNDLLRERVPKDDLMDLDDIDLGFIRPRTPLDWSMAYCQSQLYVDYMKSKYGPDAPAKMLDAYRDGLDTAAALRRACGVEKTAFEKGYRVFLGETVKAMGGKPPAKERSFKELQADHDKNPGDLDTAAELAEAYLNRKENGDARKLAQEVLDKNKTHPRASYVLARLAHQAGDDKQALELLEAALDKNDPDVKVLQALAKIYYEAMNFEKAAEVCDLGRKAEPYNSEWLEQLARVYAQIDAKDKQIAVLKDLVPTDADDIEHRKRLARLLLDKQQYAEAEKYARQAIEIDIRDTEARDDLLQALRAQKKDAEAERLEKMLGK
jgi:tetratricopeptide (TPR) repeat protein